MPEKEIADAIPEASVSVTIEEGSVDGISHQAQVTPSSEDGVPDATFEASVAVTIEEGSVDGISNQTQVASSSEDQVDEDLDQDWVDSIKDLLQPTRLKGSSIVKSCSIHRVPHRLRQHDEKAYVPHVISIGPFHYDKRKDRLRDMEEHKSRYPREILARNGLECFENCLKAVKKLEKDARACYSEEIDLSSNDFVEMMVVDGCFLIELFSRKWYPFLRREGDPLLPPNWLRTSLICDLMMLENQIPFFILEKLLKIMKIRGASSVMLSMVLKSHICKL